MSVKSGNSGRSRQHANERYIEANVDCKKHSNVNFDDGYRSTSSPSCQQKNSVGHLHSNTGCKPSDDCWQSVGSNQDQKLKEHKAEVHRLAEFVCGDWSEHISSSGKRYYYNCKTEISQWEKPKEWIDELSVRSGFDCLLSKQGVDEKFDSIQHDSDDSLCNVQHRKAINHISCTGEASYSTLPGKFQNDSKILSASPLHSENYSSTTSLKAESSAGKSRYGSISASGVVCSAYQHNGSRSTFLSKDIRSMAEEDMDISPGSTPTEESLHEKTIDSGLFSGRQSTSVANEACSGLSHMTATSTVNSNTICTDRVGSSDMSTFLRTLMSLQQVLSNVSPSGGTSLTRSMPPSALSVLASLPSLVSQLQEAEHGASESDHVHGINHQHVMQQVITMLQKLQQALVAQQQQQQQRQLQELLVQLLNMHTATPVELHFQNITNANASEHVLCKSGKLESPYSPPDSDGTPLGSPENSGIAVPDHGKGVHDAIKCNESPSSNGHNGCSVAFQSTSVSPNRTVDENQGLTSGPGSVLLVHTSSGLVGTSHLAAAVNRKHPDSINLTPTLTHYVNNRLMSHLAGWPTDSIERQINCYYEESNSISSLQCSQISVDLKQARSLVRLNEIQTTLQEQRVMFIRHQTKDLENMRMGCAFQTNAYNVDM